MSRIAGSGKPRSWPMAGPGTSHAYPETVWWTRHKVAVALTLIGHDMRGPYFEWGAGDLVVTVREVGTRSGLWTPEAVTGRKVAGRVVQARRRGGSSSAVTSATASVPGRT